MPTLRFPEFTSDWTVKTLGEFMTFKNGINADKQQYGQGYKFINVLDIIANQPITHDNILGCVDVSADVFEKSKVTYGDILFQRSSETREEAGQANVYLDQAKPATFGGFVIRGKSKGNYHPVFMNFLLKTGLVRKEITSRSGGSTRYNVGQATLENTPVTITASDEEQQKIADFLTAVDTKIQQLKRKHDLMQQYKKGVMQQLFSQQVRFKDDNGQDYPDWEEKRLGDVASFFSGGTPTSTNPFFYVGDIPFIKSGEINSDKTAQCISAEALQLSSAKLVNKGDLLFALYGATSGEVAISKINGAINQAVLCIRSKQNSLFIFNFLIYMKEQIVGKFLQGGQGNLSAQIVKSIEVSLPCKKEQEKIAGFLAAIDRKIQQIRAQIEKAETFKQGLLQQMFV